MSPAPLYNDCDGAKFYPCQMPKPAENLWGRRCTKTTDLDMPPPAKFRWRRDEAGWAFASYRRSRRSRLGIFFRSGGKFTSSRRPRYCYSNQTDRKCIGLAAAYAQWSYRKGFTGIFKDSARHLT